jgi:hypothetical protein
MILNNAFCTFSSCYEAHVEAHVGVDTQYLHANLAKFFYLSALSMLPTIGNSELFLP